MQNLELKLILIILIIKFDIALSQIKCTSLESSTIETKSGKIKGLCSFVNAHDKIGEDRSANVYKYLSIPYAEPPIDEKRFKEPIAKKPWSETLEASSLPKSCPQMIQTNISSKLEFTNSFGLNKNAIISEDCLYLNVYTTSNDNKKSKDKRPVMVVLHGGSDRESGSSVLSINDPSVFVAMTGIVVVTLNYRLGIFGNLYYNNGTEFFQGNQGFLDQHLALKWINENAAKFGGDPNRITLMGYGSGALYASYHMVYKPSWLLFRNVILQSFSPINLAKNHLSAKSANNRLTAFVQHLNCTSLKCLYDLNSFNLTLESSSFLNSFMSNRSRLSSLFLKSAFQPVIDGKVFTESVIKSFKEGRFKKCFMIVGFNANDAASIIPLNYGLNGNVQTINFELFVQFLKKYYNHYPNWPMKSNDYFIDTIINEYTKNVTTNANYFVTLRKILTDESTACSMFKLLEYLTRHSDKQQRIYFYIYEHRISTSKWPSSYGVVNGDELASLFGQSFNDQLKSNEISANPWLTSTAEFTKTDRLVSKEVISRWSNFMYNDDPNKQQATKAFKLRDSPAGKIWHDFKMNQVIENKNMNYFSFKSSGTFSFRLFNNQTTVCNVWNKLIPINVEKQGQQTKTLATNMESTTTSSSTTTTIETTTLLINENNSTLQADTIESDIF